MRNIAYFLLSLVFFATSCSGESGPSVPDTVPDIEGTIASLKRTTSKTEQAVAVVLIEAIADLDATYPQASVRIDEETRIEDSGGSVLEMEQLQEQQQVEVWFDGPVMESHPVQARAAAIRIKK